VTNRDGSKECALVAVQAALEKNALEPVLLDVSAESTYTDYILVLSGRSDRQVLAISQSILERCTARRMRPVGFEGTGEWTLIDFGDVVVHVFHHPTREFYDVEGLWSEAPRVHLSVPEDARAYGPMY
jgi:ribosome-associated protein